MFATILFFLFPGFLRVVDLLRIFIFIDDQSKGVNNLFLLLLLDLPRLLLPD